MRVDGGTSPCLHVLPRKMRLAPNGRDMSELTTVRASAKHPNLDYSACLRHRHDALKQTGHPSGWRPFRPWINGCALWDGERGCRSCAGLPSLAGLKIWRPRLAKQALSRGIRPAHWSLQQWRSSRSRAGSTGSQRPGSAVPGGRVTVTVSPQGSAPNTSSIHPSGHASIQQPTASCCRRRVLSSSLARLCNRDIHPRPYPTICNPASSILTSALPG